MGLIAGVLLAVRQQRIQAAHELARAQTRLMELDRVLLRLRLQIAAKITPDQVERRAGALSPGGGGRLLPLTVDRYRELTRGEAEAASRTSAAMAAGAAW